MFHYTPFKQPSAQYMSNYVPTISMSGMNQCTVVDLGSRYIRLGEAGDVAPSYRYYSLIGVDNCVNECKYEQIKCKEFIKNGLITDFEAFELKLGSALQTASFGVGQSISIVQPYFSPIQQREKLCETLFERLGARAVHFADAEAMACVAAGRQTGVSVILGHGASTVAPVVDGQVLRSSAAAFFWNGEQVGKSLGIAAGRPMMCGENLHCSLKFQQDLMQLCLQVSETPLSAPEALEGAGIISGDSNVAQLPDGTFLEASAGRVAKILPECLFNTQLWALVSVDGEGEELVAYNSLQYQFLQSTRNVPAQVRRELAAVTLAGGLARMPGLTSRFRTELEAAFAVQSLSGRPRVALPEVGAPDDAPFTGASIIASLGVFGCLVFTAQEYKESGIIGLERKRL